MVDGSFFFWSYRLYFSSLNLIIILRNDETSLVLRNEIGQSKSKIGLKKMGATQFKTTKNANTFKDFYSHLAENLVRKLLVALNKFNNSTK